MRRKRSETLLDFLCDNCGELNTITKFIRLHDPEPNFYRNSPRYFYRYLFCKECDLKFRLELLTTFSSEFANIINCGENTLEQINTSKFLIEQQKSGLLVLKEKRTYNDDTHQYKKYDEALYEKYKKDDKNLPRRFVSIALTVLTIEGKQCFLFQFSLILHSK